MFSGRKSGKVVFDPEKSNFSGKLEGLRKTFSSKLNSNVDSNGIGESRGSITVELIQLSFIEGNFDRQKNTHHQNLRRLCVR